MPTNCAKLPNPSSLPPLFASPAQTSLPRSSESYSFPPSTNHPSLSSAFHLTLLTRPFPEILHMLVEFNTGLSHLNNMSKRPAPFNSTYPPISPHSKSSVYIQWLVSSSFSPGPFGFWPAALPEHSMLPDPVDIVQAQDTLFLSQQHLTLSATPLSENTLLVVFLAHSSPPHS